MEKVWVRDTTNTEKHVSTSSRVSDKMGWPQEGHKVRLGETYTQAHNGYSPAVWGKTQPPPSSKTFQLRLTSAMSVGSTPRSSQSDEIPSASILLPSPDGSVQHTCARNKGSTSHASSSTRLHNSVHAKTRLD